MGLNMLSSRRGGCLFGVGGNWQAVVYWVRKCSFSMSF